MGYGVSIDGLFLADGRGFRVSGLGRCLGGSRERVF